MGRYRVPGSVAVAEGWVCTRLTSASDLFGANGMCTGEDGRIYITQLVGSEIDALDVDTGEIEPLCSKGGDIVAPDDAAFDSRGYMYVTDPHAGRVSVRTPDGQIRVLRDDLPAANGITIHNDRLFVNECRPGGRLVELDRDSGAMRVLAEGLSFPNGMQVGPDGLLYYPAMHAGEVWRISLEGGEPERVIEGLHGPCAVKFDPNGFLICTQSHAGDVVRCDTRTGKSELLANAGGGLDNLTLVGNRIFTSSWLDGQITEIFENGNKRVVLPGGFLWPFGLQEGDDGALYIADGFSLRKLSRGGSPETVGVLFAPGFPISPRDLAPSGEGEFAVTTLLGEVYKYSYASGESELLAKGFDQLCGVAVHAAKIYAAELGAGRVLRFDGDQVEILASGLAKPAGVALADDGSCFVSESGSGRIVKVSGSGAETVLDGLQQPQGIAVQGDQLYIVDAGNKVLIAFDLTLGTRTTIASGLAVGAPPGVVPKPLTGSPGLMGPLGPFAGIAVGKDGTIYVSCDADGSVVAIRRDA
ncbi:SMP-30/gluconolactonase/LRE family protein [Novosphingobium colocasiae]|uniref:Gluconolaconase n=1 Tax=Novosphingobium colocasiae TaxID=1256513 RepID=A0A918PP44_9SPHN|nr:SMP-30/gluconolactonase/LRE family protein [Novosphingobium colocasiae]GGZ16389.1 gluconolaconase [Novosphingobium colocasiae]